MIIDFHTHCFADKVAAKAIPKLESTGNVKAFLDGTVSDLKQSMKAANIDISVVQTIATKASQTEIINRWILKIRDNNLIPFATIHPDFNNWKEEIEWLVSQGIKGIKFHPDYQDFFVDDEKLYPLYDFIFSNNLIVLFHAGLDVAYTEPFKCTPKRLRKLLRVFPKAKIIAAHLGGYCYWEDVEKYLVGEEIYIDTSLAYEKLGPNKMKEIIQGHGIEKVLFATDSPWSNQHKEVLNIKSMGMNNNEVDAILGTNAQKLLGI